jgi:hypothetical protein
LKRPTKTASPNQESPIDKDKTLEEGNRETLDELDEGMREKEPEEITAIEDQDNTLSLQDDNEEGNEKIQCSKNRNSV